MATEKKAPGAGRSTKPQTPVEITWDLAETRVAVAVKGEGEAHKKWITAADTLWILGVRPKDFDDVPGPKGLTESDTWIRVRKMVIKGFTPRVQNLLDARGAALSGLTEEERGDKRYWTKRIPVMMGRVIFYLKRHEENAARGPQPKVTLAQSIVKILQKQKDRVKKADDTKIDFDRDTVLECFGTLIAELT